MRAARVLIVDDHPLVRDGFRSTLDGAKDIKVVGEAADGLDAEAKALRLKPDLILLDISLPLRDGIETVRAIRARLPDARIVMLTAWADPDKLVEAIEAGAEGYITKDMPSHKVIAALRAALAGEPPIAGDLALQALRRLDRAAAGPDPGMALSQLTIRQMQIVRLLTDGLSNKEIATTLGIAEQTVASHLKRIFKTLGVHGRAGAAWAYLRGAGVE